MKQKLLFFLTALLSTMTTWADVGDEYTVYIFKYKVTSEHPNTVELVGYETAPSSDVEIPELFGTGEKDYVVTSIGDRAFSACHNVTSVTIPASVESIGINAFASMLGLKSVTFAEGSKLKTINSGGFQACPKLESIDLPAGLETISIWAFTGCGKLSSVTLHEGLKTIEDQAFKECKSLLSVNIPASVESIDPEAFQLCTLLKSITVEAESEHFASIDGVLFSKDEKTLVIYPVGKVGASYTIPDGVTSIGNEAFLVHFCLIQLTTYFLWQKSSM